MSIVNEEQFQSRHIGPGADETEEMLRAVGAASLDELVAQTIPGGIRRTGPLKLPAGVSERAFLEELRKVASKNRMLKSFIGQGYYGTITPGVILRNIFENPGWYTQYTPYQAEISQGRLEALLNFQTMICDLTGMDVANASLLDEGTAAAEAMAMLHGIAAKSANGVPTTKFFVSNRCFAQTIDVVKTRALPLGLDVVVADDEQFQPDHSFFGALLQYPAEDGAVVDYRGFIERAHAAGIHVVVAADLLGLALLTPPGEFGADVVVGSSQRFGVPIGYGGPHAAYFATRTANIRRMPGRIIGVSIDAQNHQAYRMALQTREQHIRREKATSNICTAQALLAIMAGMYAVYHGPKGIQRIATRVHQLTAALEKELSEIGCRQLNAAYFDTLKIELPRGTKEDRVRTELQKAGYNIRYFDDRHAGISLDETATETDVVSIAAAISAAAGATAYRRKSERELSAAGSDIPAPHRRSGGYLSHPVFNRHHSETEMLRYIKTLEGRDLSLAHSMIPLGSCTMKLNATTELVPISWPEFAHLHPFAPAEQAEGYRQVFREIEAALCEITGFAAASLQPNSGAQGEFTGLMVIRAYHADRGDSKRNVALIPSSAHGTNPASAVMAGFRVVVVQCDEKGNIDLKDLRARAEEHRDSLAALMVTYPSTHGVFEEEIREICAIVHANGGLVYMDGANMNAQVGFTAPALIGADVCHINLHKTFAIPHGGGGPGLGPICVAAHLAPFLPGHPIVKTGGAKAIHAVASSPWSSASILLISYAYIRMLGADGLAAATAYAILNANYLKARLEAHFPVLYQGSKGRVAHEFILNMKEFKETCGVEVEDIAKRLMDYGFHAPTVSFPVHDTLMIEPTESEPKEELDRFADALIAIKEEIAEISSGKADRADNLLKNAPHTAAAAVSDTWNHPYSRERAVFPLSYIRDHKFWPPVGRINNTYGDKNVVCTCPPIASYIEEAV